MQHHYNLICECYVHFVRPRTKAAVVHCIRKTHRELFQRLSMAEDRASTKRSWRRKGATVGLEKGCPSLQRGCHQSAVL